MWSKPILFCKAEFWPLLFLLLKSSSVFPSQITEQNFALCLLCKKYCLRVLLTSATGVFRLDKILSDLTKLQRNLDKKISLGSPIFCQAILSHFFVCLVSQNPFSPSILINARSKVRQTEKHFSATSMDRENVARFPCQNFDFQRFQGAAGIGPYVSLLTDEQ